MAETLAELGIERDPAYLYFVRRGDVWRIARPSAEGRARRAELVAETGVAPDAHFIHFLDRAGNLCRVRRAPVAPKLRRRRTGPVIRGKAKKQPARGGSRARRARLRRARGRS